MQNLRIVSAVEQVAVHLNNGLAAGEWRRENAAREVSTPATRDATALIQNSAALMRHGDVVEMEADEIAICAVEVCVRVTTGSSRDARPGAVIHSHNKNGLPVGRPLLDVGLVKRKAAF